MPQDFIAQIINDRGLFLLRQIKNPTAGRVAVRFLVPERRMRLKCISTSLVCRYVGERDTQILDSGVQGIVDREGFVVQAVHYAL
jgi:hypothetical protein